MKNPLPTGTRARLASRGCLLAVILSPAFPTTLLADVTVAPPALEFTSGLPGKQVRLAWTAEPGLRYLIEKSTTLATGGAGAWSRVAVIDASGNSALWTDPEATTTRAFYRITQPQAEVTAISPPLLSSSGGTLLLSGQRIPAGSSLVLEIEGQAPASIPLSSLGGGLWQAAVSGTFTPGSLIIASHIVDDSGLVLLTLNQPLTVTDSGRAEDIPPSSPPAAPVFRVMGDPVPGIGLLAPVSRVMGDPIPGIGLLAPVSRVMGDPVPGIGLLANHRPRPSAIAASDGIDDDCDGLGDDDYQRTGLPAPLSRVMGDPVPGIGLLANHRPRSSAIAASGGIDDDCDDLGDDDYQRTGFIAPGIKGEAGYAVSASSKKGYDYYKAQSDMARASVHTNPYFQSNTHSGSMPSRCAPNPSSLPGEVSFQSSALSLPCPAGPALDWICTYRSLKPTSSGHGPGWDFCYNIFIEPLPAADGASAARVVLHDGAGHTDTLHRQPDGTYRCAGMFREGRFSGDSFTLTFADTGTWTFNPLGTAAASGKISAITDRNGVALACGYNPDGTLASVTDDFGRSLSVEWDDTATRILAVKSGRGGAVYLRTEFIYSGNSGTLASLSCPFAPGEAAVCNPATFIYDSSAADPRLADNLLSLSDGAGRTQTFAYSSSTTATAVDYDVCTSSHSAGSVTGPPRISSFEPTSNGNYLVIRNDETGRVTESVCDARHRILSTRRYTGFATPGVPVTSTTNRPTGKLRAGDPDFFETTRAFNTNHLPTRITHPDGSQRLVTYSCDLDRACPVREGANPRVITLATAAGETRTVTCHHLPGFGFPEAVRPGGVLDPDDDGDTIPTSSSSRGWDGTYKGKRPSLAMAGNGVDDDCDGYPDDDDTSSSRKILDRGEAGDNVGFTTRMTSSLGQTTSWTYDDLGNRTATISPVPGRGSLYEYNDRGQCTSVTTLNGTDSSFRNDVIYDPATGFPGSVVCDSTGLQITTGFLRDAQGRVTSVTDARGFDTLYAYNPLHQCVQVSSPPTPNRISMNLTIDAGGLPARVDTEHRGPDGTLDASNPAYSSYYFYDNFAQLTRVACEDRPSTDFDEAAIENFAVRDYTYDNAGQVIRVGTPAACRAQTTDLACAFSYDERGLLHRHIEGDTGDPDATGTVTRDLDYDEYGDTIRCATTADGVTSLETFYTYDGFHRPTSVTDPMGNQLSFAYDNQGHVTVSVFGEVNDVQGSTGNVLLARETHNSGTVTWTAGNLSGTGHTTRRRVEVLKSNKQGDPDANRYDFGTPAFFVLEVEDDTISVERFAPGQGSPHATEITVVDRSPAGLVQSVTRNGDLLFSCSYDSAGRCSGSSNSAVTVDFVLDQAGQVLASGERYDFRSGPPSSQRFTRSYVYDALGRMTRESDGTGNSTSFTHDSLGRCVSVTEPGGRVVQAEYDGTSAATGPFSQRVLADLNGDGAADLVCASLVRSGECRSVTGANEYTALHSRDALGRLVRCDYPDGTFKEWGFDSLGRNSTRTCQDSSIRSTSHDLNGRVVSYSWSNVPVGVMAAPDTIYQHDGLGRCVSATQGGSVLVFAYDSLGNPIGETSSGSTVARSFNHRGRTGITYPDGRAFSENRDEFGNLLSVSEVIGGVAVSPPVVSMEYLGRRVAQSTQANGVVTDYIYRADGEDPLPGEPDASFDSCVRVTVRDASSNVLTDTILRRDQNQRVSREETAFSSVAQSPGRTKSFTRDAAGRIVAFISMRRENAGAREVEENNVRYELGTDGRRLSEIRNSVAGNYTQSDTEPPADRQMGQYTTWPGSPNPIEWDDNGNLGLFPTPTTRIAFTHDVQGRVSSVSDVSNPDTPVTLVSYDYDALGRCVSRTTGGSGDLPPETTGFVYDGSACIQELGDDGTGTGTVDAATTFVCSDGLTQCISTRNGTLYYPHGGTAAAGRGVCPGGGRVFPQPGYWTDLVTSDTGAPVERFGYDDACKPVFLTSEGLPTSNKSAVGPIRWMAPESMWEPDFGMFVCPGGIYSPDLGQPVSSAAPAGNAMKKNSLPNGK